MSLQKNPNRLPIWLIVVAIAIVLPQVFRFVFPFLLIVWILWLTIPASKWKEVRKQWSPKGFDISRFQNESSSQKSSSFFPFFKNTMNEFQFRPVHLVGFFGFIIAGLLIADGFYNVPPGHVAVVYDRGQGVLEQEVGEGLHIKIPFWQTVTKMDTRLQAYTMSLSTGEGEYYGDDSIEALTKDGQKVDIDLTLKYKIDQQEASKIYQEIGLDYEEKIIRPEVRSIVREVITGYESKQLFNLETRQQASLQMEEELASQYASKDILLDSLDLRNVRFSDVYLNAIEEKQVAQQQIEKEVFEKEQEVIRADKKLIAAEATAKQIRLEGEALRDNPEMVQYEFVKKMSPQINWGILPDGALPLIDVKELQE